MGKRSKKEAYKDENYWPFTVTAVLCMRVM